jgi:acetylornithine deacetylase
MTRLEQLLSDLVAIDSINPDLVPGAAGEAAVAAFIADWLRAAGLEVHLAEVRPGRPNVVGIAHGAGGGRSLLLNGHIDTVGVAGMSQPFRPRVEGGKLYGRGAYDMKGGMAACLIAAAEAARLNLRGDVIVTAVMDEEYAGLGTLAIADQVRADGAIVAEPTELQLVVAHKGFVWLEVETQGVAAHGSRPHLGVDAIAKMGGVLTGLERLAAELAQRPPHPLLGPPSVHASTIQGGGEWSTYPDRCTLAIERRTLPGETGDTAEAELRVIVDGLAAADPAFKAVVRRDLVRSPLETPAGAAIFAAVQQAAAGVLGKLVEPTGVSFWTDAASLHAAGIPTVLFGPLGAGAHAAEEWVDLASVQRCADVYLATAAAFCA